MTMIRLMVASAALAMAAIVPLGYAHEVGAKEEEHDYPEARLYDASINAAAAVDAAFARAAEREVNVLIVMGANWCHDSRAFAGWMETERFKQLIAEKYELVYVNVGRPQSKDGHNLHIAERFGIEIEGTPTVVVTSPLGEVLNADSAKTWRNAASRKEDDIYNELASFEMPEG